MMTRMKLGIFFKNIWNGALGIIAELLTVLVFIFAGLIISLLWWSFLR